MLHGHCNSTQLDPVPLDCPRGVFILFLWLEIVRPPKVAHTTDGNVTVSTIFVQVGDPQDPLFETMIFGGEHNEEAFRSHTYEEALKKHSYALDLAGLPNHREETDITFTL